MKYVFLATILLMTAACSTVKDYAKEVTDKVCSMNVEDREALRTTVDAATFPNKIRVECAK